MQIGGSGPWRIHIRLPETYFLLQRPPIVALAALTYMVFRFHGKWVFQDLDYICCSSYGRPRSKSYHFKQYKELLTELGLPDIRFHDLRVTYATLLVKNDINQKAVAEAMGHANSIITVDVYTDKKVIVDDWVENIQPFIDELHPYSDEDKILLEKKQKK